MLSRINGSYIEKCIKYSGEFSEPSKIRQHIYTVLPSFTGSPRHMQQLYQDAMAIVRKHGRPDLFIIMTCNLG